MLSKDPYHSYQDFHFFTPQMTKNYDFQRKKVFEFNSGFDNQQNLLIFGEMGLEPVPLKLEHVATNRSRNHHSTHLDHPFNSIHPSIQTIGLWRHARTEEVRVQAPSLY